MIIECGRIGHVVHYVGAEGKAGGQRFRKAPAGKGTPTQAPKFFGPAGNRLSGQYRAEDAIGRIVRVVMIELAEAVLYAMYEQAESEGRHLIVSAEHLGHAIGQLDGYHRSCHLTPLGADSLQVEFK